MKLKRHIVLPLVMLISLAVMAIIGYRYHVRYYWPILAASLLIIAALYWSLRKKEQLRQRRQAELDATQYAPYPKDNPPATSDTNTKDKDALNKQ